MEHGSLSIHPPLSKNFGWLRHASFDLTLIIGVAALALLSGLIVVLKPELFSFVVFLDLWFLGYHHVIATFTRLSFDSDSFKQYKFLVVWLPMIVVAGGIVAVMLLGRWILASTFFYWQWFHYTRQSYGIARVYQCKTNPQESNLDKAIIYVLPLTGILYRSYQNPPTFLNMELKMLPVSWEFMQGMFAISAFILVIWIIKGVKDLLSHQSSLAHFLFMCSHIIIFSVGYVLTDNINHGWLVLNVWHNAQYILFVWMYNNKRFNNQIDARHRFLSNLSLAKNQWLYYLTCVGISTLVYLTLKVVLGSFRGSPLPLALVVYATINFHHYIVDGIIWKVRKKSIRQTLDIKGIPS